MVLPCEVPALAALQGTRYTFFYPPRSVLGVFWASLSQMTYNPPIPTQNMRFEAKVNFLAEDPFKQILKLIFIVGEPVPRPGVDEPMTL